MRKPGVTGRISGNIRKDMTEKAPVRSFWHPTTRFFRFGILVFISLLTFGSYFAYDIIGAIAPTLVE
jgi:hypothetical protein